MSSLPKTRFDDNIKTRNWRLKQTRGTDTKFTLEDKRTGVAMEFDAAYVGLQLGRGEVITLYAGAEEPIDKLYERSDESTKIANIYQHDVEQEILTALEHIQETNELPEADYVKGEL